ncbi:MAG: cell wall hydrolase [Lachnospiraceae bacterium]|jgi:N-acetylmuramoyl-L-alanine amidase
MKVRTIRNLSGLGAAAVISFLMAVPVFAESTWEDKAAADVNTRANIRCEATIDSERVGSLPRGCVVTVVGEAGDWTQVVSDEVEGYIRSDLLAFGEDARVLYEETFGEPEGEYNGAQEAEEAYASAEAVSYSQADLDLMASIIECEAGGECYEGKIAVGAVILNRVRSDRFPDTLEGVIYQSGQFSPAASGKLSRVLARGASEACYEAARDVFAGANTIGDKLFFNCGGGKGIQIGNQHFY